MKMINSKLKISFVFILVTWLFTGIYQDDEFYEYDIFLKYRPTFQYHFRSPLGMQDMPKDYPIDLMIEQAVFDEFINQKHWSDNDFLEITICGILYLGSIYFLSSGIIKQLKK